MNKITRLTLLSFCFVAINRGYTQDQHLSSEQGEVSVGIGAGLPYGALGIRLGVNLIDELNLFGGMGYQDPGIRFNIGLRKDFRSSKKTQLYLTGMYGTNSSLRVGGVSVTIHEEIYTGLSFGSGVKINSRKKEGNYWDFGLLVPIRSSKYKDDFERFKNDPRVDESHPPFPILFVVGYNFGLWGVVACLRKHYLKQAPLEWSGKYGFTDHLISIYVDLTPYQYTDRSEISNAGCTYYLSMS